MASSNFNPRLLFIMFLVLAFATAAASLRTEKRVKYLDTSGFIGKFKEFKNGAEKLKNSDEVKQLATYFRKGVKHGAKEGVKDAVMNCDSYFCNQFQNHPEVLNYLARCRGCAGKTGRHSSEWITNNGQP